MHGLYVVWWVREKHVPVAAVAAMLAAGDLAVTLLEVPTGWLADRVGHRASLIAGSLFQIAGMVSAWLGAGVPGVLASSLLIAAGDAFRSGADQALLYRSCAALGASDFQRREAHARGLQLGALVLLVLAGGAIVQAWGFAAAWIVETLSCVVGLAIALAMVEPPPAPDLIVAGAVHVTPRGPRESAGVRRVASLIALVAPAAFIHSLGSAGVFIVQSSADADPVGMTVFVACVTLAEAVGSFVGGRIVAGVGAQFVLAAVAVGLAGAPLVDVRTFHPVVVALSFLIGLAYPLRAAAIQRAVADGVRARAASLASACDKALATVALIGAGVIPRSR